MSENFDFFFWKSLLQVWGFDFEKNYGQETKR